MKKWICLALLAPLLAGWAAAQPLEELRRQLPQTAQQAVEDTGEGMMEKAAQSLWRQAGQSLRRHLQDSCRSSLTILAVCALISLGQGFVEASGLSLPAEALNIAGICAVTALALSGAGSLFSACGQALEQMDALLKTLIPSFVAAMAASGNPISSATASSATVAFAGLLVSLGKNLVFPAVRLTIVLWAAGLAAGGPLLQKAAGFLRWLCMAGFKALLTVFTMYITMSGVMSAGADAAAAKAARVTISGVVPVLGSILSDASDTLLAGARALKNGVGVMGMIGAVAVCLTPFVRCLCFMTVYKGTAALSHSFAGGAVSKMVEAVGEAYSVLLGLLAACCALVFIAIVACTVVIGG